MPNRLIYENALTSRKVNKLTDSQEKFWWRLILCCDDFGCFFGEPDVLCGKVYPRQNVSEEDVLSYRNALVNVGLAFLYEYDGEIYLCINQWEDMQTVRTPRRKFPEPTTENRLSGNPATICDNLQHSETVCDKLSQSETKLNKKMSSRARAESISNPSRIHLDSESEYENESKGGKPPKAPAKVVKKSEFENAIDDFLEMRKKIKKPATDRAMKTIRGKLEQMAPGDEATQILIIEQSIEHCWQTVYPLKAEYGNRQSGTSNNSFIGIVSNNDNKRN